MVFGRAAPARVLPGLLRLPPGKDFAGGTRFVPLLLCVLGLGVVLAVLGFGFSPLPCVVWPWRAALTASAQVKGYKGVPLLLYTDRSPRAWATHKHDTLLGQAQNGARAGGVVFTMVKFPRAAPPTM